MQKRIEAYNLVEFIQMIVKETKDGYEIDFTDNASAPVGSMGWYKCVMNKGNKVAALLKPKKEPSVEIEQQLNGVSEDDVPKSGTFVPSIVFEVNEPLPKPRGRPKASQV